MNISSPIPEQVLNKGGSPLVDEGALLRDFGLLAFNVFENFGGVMNCHPLRVTCCVKFAFEVARL